MYVLFETTKRMLYYLSPTVLARFSILSTQIQYLNESNYSKKKTYLLSI